MPQMQADRHWKKNCPNGSPGCSPKSTSGGKSTGSKQQKKCDPPKNKKYHCALHKDTWGKGGLAIHGPAQHSSILHLSKR